MSFDTDFSEQFQDITLAENPDPRAPVAVILDCSKSMAEVYEGQARSAMEELNDALDVLVTELHKDPLARRRVEVSFVLYGSHSQPATPFATVENMVLPTLAPLGLTATGEAINVALDALEARKAEYKANGIQYYRPWVLLLSDGMATDDITAVAQRVKQMEAEKKLAFFAVGVEGAEMEQLSSLTTRGALALQGLKFRELFQWLSASQSSVSASQPGDRVGLPEVSGWAEI